MFAAMLGAWIAISVFVLHQPFHVGLRRLRYFDLQVYRGGASLVRGGRSLYGTKLFGGLHFTYPPIAAILFVPFTFVSLDLAEVMVTALNIAALVWLLRLALELHRGSRRSTATGNPWLLVGPAAAAALWLEPVSTTLGYGQIDLMIAALVVFDLVRLDATRTKGAAIGLAAAVKLTPLLFVPYLLLTGRRRAAAIAAGVFAATVAAGFALLPSDSSHYWGGLFLDSSRVGRIVDWANQSLQGAIARLSGAGTVGLGWLVVVAGVAVAGLATAVMASRRGDEATGFSLCALTALLSSPVSWTHHWALAVPALFLLALGAYERRSRALLTAATLVAVVAYAYIPERIGGADMLHLTVGGLVAADPYVLIGLIAIGGSSVVLLRTSPASGGAIALT